MNIKDYNVGVFNSGCQIALLCVQIFPPPQVLNPTVFISNFFCNMNRVLITFGFFQGDLRATTVAVQGNGDIVGTATIKGQTRADYRAILLVNEGQASADLTINVNGSFFEN
jgi:hypothetical protein